MSNTPQVSNEILPRELVVNNKLDIFAMSESWLKANNNKDNTKPERIHHHEILPTSHHLIHMPRPTGGRGGGIAVIHDKSIKVKVHAYSGQGFNQFEYFVCNLNIKKTTIMLIVVYRPKPTSVNNLNVKKFWRQFEKFIQKYASTAGEIIVTGDLNFHLNKHGSGDTIELINLLNEYDLTQKIQIPTHIAGNILDVLVVRNDCSIIKSIDVSDPALCNDEGKVIKDHFLICWTTTLRKSAAGHKTITFRAYNKIDLTKFENDLTNSELCSLSEDNDMSSSEVYNLYSKTLSDLIEIHAPLQTKVIYDRPNTKWYNSTVSVMKREKRQAERKARSTDLEVNWSIFRQKSAELNKYLLKVKIMHYSQQIIDCKRDQKLIFQVANSWMGNTYNSILPACDDKKQLAQNFQDYFKEKVDRIHTDLSENLVVGNPFIPIMSIFDSEPPCSLPSFLPVTSQEVQDIMLQSNSKHCGLDPIATKIAKKFVHLLCQPVAMIINKSFESGLVPTELKSAHIRPSIKKRSLDPEENENYRPVSNLPYVSKILEKAVNTRLEQTNKQ